MEEVIGAEGMPDAEFVRALCERIVHQVRSDGRRTVTLDAEDFEELLYRFDLAQAHGAGERES